MNIFVFQSNFTTCKEHNTKSPKNFTSQVEFWIASSGPRSWFGWIASILGTTLLVRLNCFLGTTLLVRLNCFALHCCTVLSLFGWLLSFCFVEMVGSLSAGPLYHWVRVNWDISGQCRCKSNSSSSKQVFFFGEIVLDGLQPIFLRVSFNTVGGWSIGECCTSPDIRRRIDAASVSVE